MSHSKKRCNKTPVHGSNSTAGYLGVIAWKVATLGMTSLCCFAASATCTVTHTHRRVISINMS